MDGPRSPKFDRHNQKDIWNTAGNVENWMLYVAAMQSETWPTWRVKGAAALHSQLKSPTK